MVVAGLDHPDYNDVDVGGMNEEQLRDECLKLRRGIRAHRDAEGHNLCWHVPELWNLLPDNIDPLPSVPPRAEFLANCAKYRDSLGESKPSSRTIVIKVGGYKIVVDVAFDDQGGSASSISSDLHEPEDMERDTDIVLENTKYNSAIDGLESLILAHAFQGVDVADTAYVRGIEDALNAISNLC
jgi:hypothetical protein